MPRVNDQRLSAGLRYIEKNRHSFNEEKKRQAIEFLDSVLSSSDHIKTKLEALFTRVDTDDYPQDLSSDANQLKEKAAEQRVLLGLADATADVLVGILCHNNDKCIEYIQARRAKSVGEVVDESNEASDSLSLLRSRSREKALQKLLIKTLESKNAAVDIDSVKTLRDVIDILARMYKGKYDLLDSWNDVVDYFYVEERSAEAFKQSNLVLNLFKKLKSFEDDISAVENPGALYSSTELLIGAVLAKSPELKLGDEDAVSEIFAQVNLSDSRAKLINRVIELAGIDKFKDLKKIADLQDSDPLSEEAIVHFKTIIESSLSVKNIDPSDMHRIRNLVAERVNELEAEALTKIRSAIDSAPPEALRLIIKAATFKEGLTKLPPPNESFQWIEDTGSTKEVEQRAKEKLKGLTQDFKNKTNPTIDELVNHILDIQALLDSGVSTEEAEQLETLKQRALESAVNQRIGEHSPFGFSARPELIEIIKDNNYELLLEIHRDAFKGFLDLEQKPESSKQLWLELNNPSTQFEGLVSENQRLALLRAMHNTPLARVFADFRVENVPLIITRFDIDGINQDMNRSEQFSDFLYILKENYGDDSELITAITSKSQSIERRFNQNKTFLTHWTNQTESEQFKNLFLTLDVDFDYTEQHIRDLLTCLATSRHRDDFMTRLSSMALTDTKGASLIEPLIKALRQVTDARFIEIRDDVRLHSTSILNALKERIKRDNPEIIKHLEATSEIESLLAGLNINLHTLSDEMERSLGLPFDRAVRENHVQVSGQFKTQLEPVSKKVKELEEYLRNLSALPEDNWLADPSKQSIESALEQYKCLERYLQTAIQRIPKVVANQSGYVFKATGFLISGITDEKLNELKANPPPAVRTNPTPTGDSEPAVSLERGLDARSSSLESRELTDSQRHHLYEHKASAGSFAQTDSNARGSGVLSKDGIVRTLPSARVSLIKEPGKATTGEDKLKFYMVMAKAMITARGGMLPTKEHPIYLSGNSPDMRYLYTAFAFLAKGDVKDVIKVMSNTFDPSTVHGLLGIKRSDLYKQCGTLFKDEPLVPEFAKTGPEQRDAIRAMRQNSEAAKKEVPAIDTLGVPGAVAQALNNS